MKLLTLIGFVCAVKYAEAACGGPFAQCGGWGFKGSSCCQSGYNCYKFNDWYSSCFPSGNSNNNNNANANNNNKNKKVTTKNTNTKKATTTMINNNNKNNNINNNNNNNNNNNSNNTTNNKSSTNVNANGSWPKAQKNVKVTSPILVKSGETFDGLAKNGVWTSYGRGVTGQGDCKNIEGGSADAVFRLESGATLKNVILGKDSIEHVHCIGDGCTVENVWWDDVCEDALSLLGSSNKNAKFYLRGGGAKNGSDKIVQHNSAGTVYINGFQVQNSGKLYRSCGNCKNGYQGQRHVVIENVNAKSVGVLAGINSNFGDTATFKNVNANGGNVCYTFTGNNNGKEPKKTGAQCKGSSTCTCK